VNQREGDPGPQANGLRSPARRSSRSKWRTGRRAGGISRSWRRLHQRGIYYAFVQKSGDNAVVMFRFDEVDKAIAVLGAGVRVLTGEEGMPVI